MNSYFLDKLILTVSSLTNCSEATFHVRILSFFVLLRYLKIHGISKEYLFHQNRFSKHIKYLLFLDN